MNKADEKRYSQDQVDLALIASDLKTVKETVDSVNRKLDANYVTKDELKLTTIQLELLQRIVYGVVGLILTAVIGGMVAFYINAGK